MNLSVVVPAYNEERNVEPLAKEVLNVISPICNECEVIIVDDGSTDRTYSILSNLHELDSRIKVLQLKRNFGQTAALAAGIDYSKGDVIVLMDGDGQNDPKDIPSLLAKVDEGFDLVCGWREPRLDPFWSRRLPSQLANSLISWITRVNLHDSGCTLKAIKRNLAKNVKLYGEMHRFIPAIAYERGAHIAEIKVHHRARRWGVSKYGLARSLRVILDLLTVKFLISYSTRPLHIFGFIGLMSGAMGLLFGIYLSCLKLFIGEEIGGRPLLLLAVLLILIGIQFVSMGLLGEMLARTYHESQDKPIYVVQNILDKGNST